MYWVNTKREPIVYHDGGGHLENIWWSYIVYPSYDRHPPVDERIAFLGYN